MFNYIKEAITELKQGKPIIVVDDENRENEGDLVALSEMVTPDVINFMITYGRGLVCAPITSEFKEQIGLTSMTNQSTDPFGTAFTISIDHKETKTGISAMERSKTIRAFLDPKVSQGDFKQPGHVFPLVAKDGGVLERPGHTEAAIDLAKMCGSFPSGVICEIIKEDGTMARLPDLEKMAETFDLKIISIKALIDYRNRHEKHVERVVETNLPTDFGTFRAIGFTSDLDDKEYIALIKGEIDPNKSTLVRIHSECLTGDIFGSHRCDCGPQLHEALTKINEKGNGILVYMRQEGRGIGLMNKLKAYKLQDMGFDTVEANEQLGFAADLREYDIAAHILLDLGVKGIELLTNNPSKMKSLESYGIKVNKRIPIQTKISDENEKYMHTKFDKMGHLLNF